MSQSGIFRPLAVTITVFLLVFLTGCDSLSTATPAGAIVGRGGGRYNYSPSVIQEGDVQRFWWCGLGNTPDNAQGDTIFYESINTVTHAIDGPLAVLGETAGSWDSLFTCNPKVIGGRFINPLGNGQTYKYEMFYVGSNSGIDNSIGAAFSNDGIQWTKYPDPVILSSSTVNYGVAQPIAYNADGGSSIVLFYEDNTPSIHHVEATSPDGIHFTVKGTLTTNGIDPLNQDPTWGDMGYDPTTGDWYATFNLPFRPANTTGEVTESGQRGFQLYRIPNSSLLTGATPWEMVKTVDTNLTGYEVNFLPSLLHDINGNINIGTYPKLELFVSTSLPYTPWNAAPKTAGKSADLGQWAIAVNSYDPSESVLELDRYVNTKIYEVTTGWTDPRGGFFPNATLGHLYTTPQNGAMQPVYNCKEGSTAYFTSLDMACNGQFLVGLDGYGYAQQPKGISTVALYNCASTKMGKFLSKDSGCEGGDAGELFAYVLP